MPYKEKYKGCTAGNGHHHHHHQQQQIFSAA